MVKRNLDLAEDINTSVFFIFQENMIEIYITKKNLTPSYLTKIIQ